MTLGLKYDEGRKIHSFNLTNTEYEELLKGTPVKRITGNATYEVGIFTLTFKGKKRKK